MSGPTLTVTVPPTVESTTPFRSAQYSTSALLSGTAARASSSRTRSLSTKSLPNLPQFDLPSFNFDSDLDTSLSFASELTKSSTNEKSKVVRNDDKPGGFMPRMDRMGKRRTMLSRPQSWMPSSRTALDQEEEVVGDRSKETPCSAAPANERLLHPNSLEKSRNVSETFASFAKRGWISASRSPSPPGPKTESGVTTEIRPSRERSSSNSSIARLRNPMKKRSGSPADAEGSKPADSRGKLGTYLTKISKRPQSVLVKGMPNSDAGSAASSTTSLAPPSTDTRRSQASETSNSTYPEDVASIAKIPPARDPLWSSFKTLETEFQRFQAKDTAVKTNLIRTALLPFLRKYATHPSYRLLHYEDLERRAIILDKWWNGLLELLDGKTQQPVPGVDKPALLDAITALMVRPEWRQSTTIFCPLVDRSPRTRLRGRPRTRSNGSSGSVDSTDSAYLAESAGHNVRTMFITNLVAQMAIVVDKLSLRHVPFSMVNFAGRACAYAFFFAPGIANILVRLWGLTPNLLRRVADEFGLPRRDKGERDEIVALFPPNLEGLEWTSVKTVSDFLRQASNLHLPAAKIPWHGPWSARWRGRDTDLFFIFCKHYFILADDFTPAGLPLTEKARSPGFVLVNAQILAVLDSTIHRRAAIEATLGPPLADTNHGADASAMALQVAPNNNIMKGMDENRLIVLLRDFLSGASILFKNARHTFAEAFMAIMKASAKCTSQFDHSACFTICDFLEESLTAYDGFVDAQRPDLTYVDWSFWFEVCQKILESNNTLSEIRVLALVFSMWDVIANDRSRKETVCLDWLITEETFNKFFNNWCPMVRAYYMRLLCWRICRDTGSANETDAKIFLLVSTRLKSTWSHYLWLKQDADHRGQFPPSTAPSFPTPGKRFMIIRTEVPAVQPGLMVGFDASSNRSRSDMEGPATDFESMATPVPTEPLSPEPSAHKKKWGVLGKVLSLTGSGAAANDLETVRRDTAAARSKPALPPKGSTNPTNPSASDSDSMCSSPTFEAAQYIFRFTLSWNPAGTMSPPNRILTRPRLPNPAQSWVNSRDYSGSSPQPPAGRPVAHRAVSGSPSSGLIDSAKNADPCEIPMSPHRISMAWDYRSSFDPISPVLSSDRTSDELPLPKTSVPTLEPIIKPTQPTGTLASGVKYSGRALAEWSLVVAECNNFVDRRRDEGVLGLSDVEVPMLGVEGFRKFG
ncbi:hypothetical protein F4778DRAFT_438396 [Xylariomycetidae sp. FL2044]|nr:hypothetical protein F4778DRAFT_438396 [Xylariomycetidae sp. FL2044]